MAVELLYTDKRIYCQAPEGTPPEDTTAERLAELIQARAAEEATTRITAAMDAAAAQVLTQVDVAAAAQAQAQAEAELYNDIDATARAYIRIKKEVEGLKVSLAIPARVEVEEPDPSNIYAISIANTVAELLNDARERDVAAMPHAQAALEVATAAAIEAGCADSMQELELSIKVVNRHHRAARAAHKRCRDIRRMVAPLAPSAPAAVEALARMEGDAEQCVLEIGVTLARLGNTLEDIQQCPPRRPRYLVLFLMPRQCRGMRKRTDPATPHAVQSAEKLQHGKQRNVPRMLL